MSQLPPEFDEADLHLQRLVRSDMLVVQHVQAVLLDTTAMGVEEAVAAAIAIVEARRPR